MVDSKSNPIQYLTVYCTDPSKRLIIIFPLIFNEENIARYLLNEMTPEEVRDFSKLADLPENKDSLDFFRKMLFQDWDIPSTKNKNKTWDILLKKRDEKKQTWNPIYVAASFLLVIGLVSLLFSSQPKEWSTDIGETKNVALPDGSQIVLNAQSKMIISDDFNENIRKINLDGEGFFDVVTNSNKPFWIEFADNSLKVVGTSFNLRARENFFKVSVSEGLVHLFDNKGNLHQILKGMTLEKIDGIWQQDKMQLDEDFAWKENKISYVNEKISNICKDVQSRFGVEMSFPKTYLNKKITLKLNSTDLDHLAQALATITQLRPQKIDKQIIFN